MNGLTKGGASQNPMKVYVGNGIWMHPISGGDGEPPVPPTADPPAPEAPPTSDVGDWTASLDPELQKSPAIKKFKGKDWAEVGPQVLKSYVNLEKWQIPGEGATDEERKAFARRRGVPEKFEEYKLDVKVPEGVEWTPEIEGEFAKFAHGDLGLTPSEATKVVNWYLERAGRGVDIQTTQTAADLKKATETLQAKWGANWKRNTGLVTRAVDDYGSEEFRTLLENQVADGMKLGNHPAMLEFLQAYGESRLEAGFIPGDSLLTSGQDALASANAILADKTHAYWRGDKAAIKKVGDLLALAHPDVKRA